MLIIFAVARGRWMARDSAEAARRPGMDGRAGQRNRPTQIAEPSLCVHDRASRACPEGTRRLVRLVLPHRQCMAERAAEGK